MNLLAISVFLLSLTVLPAIAEARVFDLAKEKLASYLTLSYGPTKVKDAAFATESTATSYNDELKTNTGGEFGLVYATPLVNWRFGFELLKPAVLGGVAAKIGSSTKYNLTSELLATTPKLGLEINLKTTGNVRFFLFGYMGQSNLTVTNSYSSLTIAPNADFVAKYKGNASSQGGGLGFEFASFDTTSLVLELGYRLMAFHDLTYAASVTDFIGAHQAGDPVLLTDGTKRQLDFSGAYASFGARFWIF